MYCLTLVSVCQCDLSNLHHQKELVVLIGIVSWSCEWRRRSQFHPEKFFPRFHFVPQSPVIAYPVSRDIVSGLTHGLEIIPPAGNNISAVEVFIYLPNIITRHFPKCALSSPACNSSLNIVTVSYHCNVMYHTALEKSSRPVVGSIDGCINRRF
jgi:hypothetical protein